MLVVIHVPLLGNPLALVTAYGVTDKTRKCLAWFLSIQWSEFLQNYLRRLRCCFFSSHSSRPFCFHSDRLQAGVLVPTTRDRLDCGERATCQKWENRKGNRDPSLLLNVQQRWHDLVNFNKPAINTKFDLENLNFGWPVCTPISCQPFPTINVIHSFFSQC